MGYAYHEKKGIIKSIIYSGEEKMSNMGEYGRNKKKINKLLRYGFLGGSHCHGSVRMR